MNVEIPTHRGGQVIFGQDPTGDVVMQLHNEDIGVVVLARINRQDMAWIVQWAIDQDVVTIDVTTVTRHVVKPT
jgi:hypothetical protein